ncbi:MAG TPA: 16S rRNA (cytosine(1402)-N(4))-methyltransferase RsmH [Phycisphaerae bacterium]|nr:16S rRNA (cytosine(1402)-N(4))-methyltransferase RsmH [Phycisphaerae bacterium]HRR86896.1 16S rRNA (cytosine(1402)-N(4))-methyltransferase RsmH [Phycisphaerae bacterium]
MPSNEPGKRPHPYRRRARYSGTHPRRFEDRYKELNPQDYPGIHEHVRGRGHTPAGTHVPVMVDEVMACLRPMPGEVVADCTVGFGGHAREFLKRIGPNGRLLAFDVDERELERTRQRLADAGFVNNVRFHRSNFAGIGKTLMMEQLDGYDVIFADLGVSSMQVDDPSRGFSYKHDGPLDMRMDQRIPRSAADWLSDLSEEELVAILRDLADEPDAEPIARQIIECGTVEPIKRTGQLVQIIFKAKRLTRRRWRERAARDQRELHPAARVFQALRILVNDELSSLRHLLRIAPSCLRPGGRIGIISFHNGEDRLVARSFREGLQSGAYASAADEAIRPGRQERYDNPRCASAMLRWAQTPHVRS